jgi:hypothetical protein
MIEALQQTGFQSVRVCNFFNSFSGTTKEKVARKYGVQGANFMAYKDA